MATLVLGSVGTLLGGPVGGAIGSLLGSRIDQAVLAPKGRRGARLAELAVQTSSYGTAIPKPFGRLRVAGTVIWASDLRETAARGGGKGRAATTTYSYSASFAVALSGRPIRSVGRIWADGKLLRGAAGDWKSGTGFRLHTGGEGQAIDPLIASAEGMDDTPAYRGIAYAVFEDMQLADYGNRIPSLTFEVEADGGPVTIADIAATLSDGAVAGTGGAMLDGYAAGGDSVRGALEGLAQAVPMVVADRGGRLALDPGDGAASTVAADAIPAIERRAAGTVPDEVTIAYHDPSRDWQAGLQRARRAGVARRTEAIELAAALGAGAAKALAEARLARDEAGRTTARVTLPWSALGLAAGDRVILPGRGERWRVAATTIEGLAVTLELVAIHRAGGAIPPASAGRAAGEPDAPPGATRMAVLDLPGTGDAPATTPRLWIAAAGSAPGWRRAMLEANIGGGEWIPAGRTAAPAIIGDTLVALPPAGAALRDEASILDVALAHDGMTLVGRDDIAAVAEANLALVGEELIQFVRAVRLGPARWRLSGLLRGRRGTEVTTTLAAGARFVLIEAAALVAHDPPATAIGATMLVEARGAGDAVPVRMTIVPAGRALRPPAPVHVRTMMRADGGIAIRWTRRSRAGFDWIDGADAPLGEEAERYRLTITTDGGGRTIETTAPSCDYSATDRAADGNTGRRMTISIAQIGGLGLPSRQATIIVG